MKVVKDFMFDFESLGQAPDCKLFDMACIVFDNNPYIIPSFKQLVDSALYVKLNPKNQKRVVDAGTIEWWKKQPMEAKKAIQLNGSEKTLSEMVEMMKDYLDKNNFDKNVGQGWCRGQSFDFPILINVLQDHYGRRQVFKEELCFFWNQRDVRTAIESMLLTRGFTNCPLPIGTLDGFIKHNSIHDTAKAILEILYAKRYAMGIEDIPVNDKIDPNSIGYNR